MRRSNERFRNYIAETIADHEGDHFLPEICSGYEENVRQMERFRDVEQMKDGVSTYNHKQKTQFEKLLEKNGKRYREQAKAREITVEIDFLPDGITQIDPFAAEMILDNLFSNALHNTGNGGTITLRSHIDKPVERVGDTGCGMPAEQAERIEKNELDRSKRK